MRSPGSGNQLNDLAGEQPVEKAGFAFEIKTRNSKRDERNEIITFIYTGEYYTEWDVRAGGLL